MNTRPFVAALLALSAAFSPQVSRAQDKPPARAMSAEDEAALEKAFAQGNALMEEKKHAEALAAYKRALAISPGDPSLLWNGGTAAFLSGGHADALSLWKQLKIAEPRDGAVRAKLIQTYAALNRKKERDAERAELLALRAEAKKEDPQSPALEEKRFCREQFSASGRRVLAYEFFEMEGERARRYMFVVLKKDVEKDVEDFHVSLGSYDTTNAVHQELKPGSERLFHLDGYYEGDVHKTFGLFEGEPTYDEVRAMIASIVAGKRKEVSSSKNGK